MRSSCFQKQGLNLIFHCFVGLFSRWLLLAAFGCKSFVTATRFQACSENLFSRCWLVWLEVLESDRIYGTTTACWHCFPRQWSLSVPVTVGSPATVEGVGFRDIKLRIPPSTCSLLHLHPHPARSIHFRSTNSLSLQTKVTAHSEALSQRKVKRT